MTESEMLKKFTAQEKYELLKKVANNQEKKEFRDIERKYKKKSSIEPRRESLNVKSDTTLPLEIPNFIKPQTAAPADDTLNKILKDRNKPDPDYFKGLGTFLPKEICKMIRKLSSANSLSYENFINGDENSWCLRVIYKNKQNNEDNKDKKESEKKIG